MTIPKLDLDNRTFDDLMEELRGLIPREAPEWTNHNLSDPGITVLELFCWMAEGILFRTNRIPEASRRRFLELLGSDAAGSLDDAVAATVRTLHVPWRAVTAADFETLVIRSFPQVARACCLPDRALDQSGPDEERIGHVSIIVVPFKTEATGFNPSTAILDELFRFLDGRRLLTCRHHVVGPAFTDVALSATVVCTTATKPATVHERIIAALAGFFAPVAATPDGKGVTGWEFGRPVHESEVCALIEGVAGVDYLESLSLRHLSAGVWSDSGRMIALPVHSLVRFDAAASDIATVGPMQERV